MTNGLRIPFFLGENHGSAVGKSTSISATHFWSSSYATVDEEAQSSLILADPHYLSPFLSPGHLVTPLVGARCLGASSCAQSAGYAGGTGQLKHRA